MIQIPLSDGKFATIDDDDFDLVSRFNWSAHHIKDRIYAVTCAGRLHMHRLLAGKPGFEVDHRNGDGLDNRRDNLRASTTSQNGMNRGPQRDNTSGFKGVTRSGRQSRPWAAAIKFNKKIIHLGRFKTPDEAARAYDAKALELFGQFAYLNFPSVEGRVSI